MTNNEEDALKTWVEISLRKEGIHPNKGKNPQEETVIVASYYEAFPEYHQFHTVDGEHYEIYPKTEKSNVNDQDWIIHRSGFSGEGKAGFVGEYGWISVRANSGKDYPIQSPILRDRDERADLEGLESSFNSIANELSGSLSGRLSRKFLEIAAEVADEILHGKSPKEGTPDLTAALAKFFLENSGNDFIYGHGKFADKQWSREEVESLTK